MSVLISNIILHLISSFEEMQINDLIRISHYMFRFHTCWSTKVSEHNESFLL